MRITYLLTLLFIANCILPNTLLSQHHSSCTEAHAHQHKHSDAKLTFIENQNQWHPNIKFTCHLGGINKVYLEEKAFTYMLYAEKETLELHDIVNASKEVRDKHMVPGHAYKVHFVNANTPTFSGSDKRSGYNLHTW